jgi:outer membrane protein assembly factor BamB
MAAAPADWPQFRGPDRTDISADKGLLKEWPEDGPPVAWKASGLGEGFSSVSVAGDRIYSMGDREDACYLIALDRTSGKEAWSAKVGKTGGNYKGPRSTPTVDGQRVYALGQLGDLLCCDVKTGDVIWKKNLVDDFKGEAGAWNYTESVLIDEGKVICTPGGQESSMVALNKNNGEVIWRGLTNERDQAAYASPVVATIDGVRQYVQLLSKGGAAFAAKDGKLLWRFGVSGDRFEDNTANIPTPIVKGNRVFFCAGYGRGGAMVEVKKEGSQFIAKELWFNNDVKNKHGGVIWLGKYLYGDTDDRGLPWCANADDGQVVWKKEKRSEGSGSAAVTAADGNLYWRYQNGIVVLAPATAKGYSETSSFKIPQGTDPSWPHPVVVAGKLYLRDQDTLWCYDVSKRASRGISSGG